MENFSFNFANLSEWQAVEQIVAQENFDFGREYKFNLYCKEGFRDVSLTVDKDGIWSYVSIALPEDEMVLAGVTTTYENGRIEYYEIILTRSKFDALKTATDGESLHDDDNSCVYVKYEDLLANW